MRLVTRLTSVGFAAGASAHWLGFVLLAWRIELYGPGYPAWRHVAMGAVDAAIALAGVIRPAWLRVILPTFAVEQLAVNGLTPVTTAECGLVLAAWLVVAVVR